LEHSGVKTNNISEKVEFDKIVSGKNLVIKAQRKNLAFSVGEEICKACCIEN